MAEAYRQGEGTGAARPGSSPPHLQNLFGEALRESSDLARKEFTLFKTEMSESVTSLFKGVALFAAAGFIAVVALIVLTGALVKWLAPIVGSEALSALIVGGVFLLVAAGLALWGKSAFSSFSLTPERTVRSIKRDTEVISERVS